MYIKSLQFSIEVVLYRFGSISFGFVSFIFISKRCPQRAHRFLFRGQLTSNKLGKSQFFFLAHIVSFGVNLFAAYIVYYLYK